MHVHEHGEHRRDKFRTVIVYVLGKNDKFLTANKIRKFEFAVRNLSFLPRTHTMTFRCEIFQDDVNHAQVRA